MKRLTRSRVTALRLSSLARRAWTTRCFPKTGAATRQTIQIARPRLCGRTLYGANEVSDLMSARLIAALMPATVRVYPTLVLEGTRLAALWRAGLYRPQTHEEAAALGARLLEFFEACGVRVIRMGLHAQPSLAEHLLAGPYHPAFRELCEGALLYGCAERLLSGRPPGRYRLHIAPKSVSKLCGHGARPAQRLRAMGYDIIIRPDAGVCGLDVKVEDV